MVTTATIAIARMRTTIAMTMGTMTVNDHGYMTATIAMTTTMTMRMHFFRAKHGIIPPHDMQKVAARPVPLNGAESTQPRGSLPRTGLIQPTFECTHSFEGWHWADSADLLWMQRVLLCLWMQRVPELACSRTDKLTKLLSKGRRNTCIRCGLVDSVVDLACEVPAFCFSFCLGR